MAKRGDHFRVDNGESYCYDTDGYDVLIHGDTVTTGPQPDSYCSGCRHVDPEWIDLELEEFNRMFA